MAMVGAGFQSGEEVDCNRSGIVAWWCSWCAVASLDRVLPGACLREVNRMCFCLGGCSPRMVSRLVAIRFASLFGFRVATGFYGVSANQSAQVSCGYARGFDADALRDELSVDRGDGLGARTGRIAMW